MLVQHADSISDISSSFPPPAHPPARPSVFIFASSSSVYSPREIMRICTFRRTAFISYIFTSDHTVYNILLYDIILIIIIITVFITRYHTASRNHYYRCPRRHSRSAHYMDYNIYIYTISISLSIVYYARCTYIHAVTVGIPSISFCRSKRAPSPFRVSEYAYIGIPI